MIDQLFEDVPPWRWQVQTAIALNRKAGKKVVHVVGSRYRGRWRYTLCRCCSYGYGRRVC